MNSADLSGYLLRAHYLRCIQNALRDGFPHLADEMIRLYRVQFPNE